MTESGNTTAMDRPSTLSAISPRTLVEQIVDAIVEAAATGEFLPGDRVVEADLARKLNVSRVPIREALRLLESQGILVNTPYRGMRLMDVSVERIEKILEVRLALEALAARTVQTMAQRDPAVLDQLRAMVDEMIRAAKTGDSFRIATLDTAIHRELCMLTGNDVLVATWEPLARQLTIIFGLAALQKDLDTIVVEHEDLLAALSGGEWPVLEELMEVHIMDYVRAVDHDELMRALQRQ